MTLRADGLEFAYAAARPVLRGVSCAAEPGRVTAILGPNGAGKSTLLRLLAGVATPVRGRVTIGRDDLATLPARARAARVGYVPQSSDVAFAFSARDIVTMGLFAGGGGAFRAEAALAQVDMLDRADDPFATLSAGQRQRVTLARALAQVDLAGEGDGAGKVLLADEPVAAMDPARAVATLDLLRDVARRGTVVVAVLHDLSLVLRAADDVVLLNGAGTVAAAGAVRDTLTAESLRDLYGIGFEALASRSGVGAFVPVGPTR